jgi:hypothetical protein
MQVENEESHPDSGLNDIENEEYQWPKNAKHEQENGGDVKQKADTE